MLKTLALN